MFEVSAILQSAIDDLLKEVAILRMKTLHQQVQGWLLSTMNFEDAVGFVRPNNLSITRLPHETPGVTESLGFGQMVYRASEFFY
jgi:hypothetical protein